MKINLTRLLTPKEQIARWRENIPDLFNGSYRRNYDKAMSGKSLRAAVTAKCLDCMCWQQAEVKNCDVITCPLYPYKPYSARQRSRGGVDTKQMEQKQCPAGI